MNSGPFRSTREFVARALRRSSYAWWDWHIPSDTVTFNDLKATMLGYDPASFRTGGYRTFTDLLHPDDFERTMQAMRDHLEGRAPIYRIDYRIKAADGHYEWYLDRGAITERSADGSPLRLRGIVIDLGRRITDRLKHDTILEFVRRALPVTADRGRLIVLCSNCTKLKLTSSVWVDAAGGLDDIFETDISHGICPACIRTLYPDIAGELH